MADESQEKQHAPTGKHLAQLRKQGNVLRSRDLSGGLIFIAAISMLALLSTGIKEQLTSNFIVSFSNFSEILHNPDYLYFIFQEVILKNFYLLLKILSIVWLVTIVSPFLFGGWNFTVEVLHFKLSKLNPIANLSRLFSPGHALIEILRSMLKSFFLLAVLLFYFLAKKTVIFNLSNEPLATAISTSYLTTKTFILILAFALMLIVLCDMFYHYFQYQQKVKMSTQDIKEEHREMEGNPETKRRLRLKQLALVKQRLHKIVPKANVIITNPTHYAIALKYESGKDHAPKVIAKGAGIMAQQIKQIAIANAVTIYEAPGLARAIYHTTKVGAHIHPALYKAVAIVLSYVYQLKNYQMGKGLQPELISHFELPEEFIYRE